MSLNNFASNDKSSEFFSLFNDFLIQKPSKCLMNQTFKANSEFSLENENFDEFNLKMNVFKNYLLDFKSVSNNFGENTMSNEIAKNEVNVY